MLRKKGVVTSLERANKAPGRGCNANPGLNQLNLNRIIFSWLKMFFTPKVWCSLRLRLLKTEGQTI